MKKFQKLFALLAVVVMVAGMMAACQTKEEEVGTPLHDRYFQPLHHQRISYSDDR